MTMNKKGMTMALGVIIAIVVLIVVALAVIAITSGALAKFGIGTSETSDTSGDCVKCLAKVNSYCISNPDDATDLVTTTFKDVCTPACLGGKTTCSARTA